jgi:glycosyltransferase involved in cell wall biosynthesis
VNQVISIITPCFNRADLVGETAHSIFHQSYPHWEWIIVDDGSTDNSLEVLHELACKDNRVKVLQRDRAPKGACTCRNIAVEESTGDYLIFLDTDDLLAPFCLEQRINAFKQSSDCDFVIFPMLLFEKKWDDLQLLWNIDNGKDDLHRILIGDPICQGTGTLWKKSSFKQVGMWREDLALWQDIELHIRSLLVPLKYNKRLDLEPDVYLRITPNSLSRGGFYSAPKTKSRIAVFSYTCKSMQEKGLFEQYRQELKNMALDITISSILGNQFDQAKAILTLTHTFQLFDAAEKKRLRNFLLIRKLKLYKIKSLDRYLLKQASVNAVHYSSEIGKNKWHSTVRSGELSSLAN